MRIDGFDYDLPQDRIAQEPAERRDESRLLAVPRRGRGPCGQHRFSDLADLLAAGDLVVVNDARVLPSRIWAHRSSGGMVEILLVAPENAVHEAAPAPPRWRALVKPARRVRPGERLIVVSASDRGASYPDGSPTAGGTEAAVRGGSAPDRDQVASGASPVIIRVDADLGGGQRALTFPRGCDVEDLLESSGRMPLPPYILRDPDDPRDEIDRRRYQTVFAREPGAIAAPTAGLHFTSELLGCLHAAGIGHASVTLHVGPGTFLPVRADQAEDHHMEAERYEIPQETVDSIERTRARGGRVVAVGTTVVRTLEHAARRATDGRPVAGAGNADLYILPGFEFQVVDAMITNFHLPRSTPLLMVSAFAGRDNLLAAYRIAIEAGYRFYSYGDAMLVL